MDKKKIEKAVEMILEAVGEKGIGKNNERNRKDNPKLDLIFFQIQ
jgi:hypothetical protein